MSRVLVGTSGWGYPSWQPGFYPAGLDRREFLSFYAGQLAAVELNATKYRLPSEEQFASWAAQVPDGFRFAVKAPNGVERRLATFEERVRRLGDRLGCVRVVVERPRDDGFLELLLGSVDPGVRYALDLRDPTWDGVEERLAEAGVARVDDRAGRAGWAYLRYRELRYTDEELVEIAADLDLLDRAGIETFAFFRHGDEPDAPRAALAVRERNDEIRGGSARPANPSPGRVRPSRSSELERSNLMQSHLDAIGITTADMSASCRFYALLGVPVGEPAAGEDHFEATLPSGIRLMWDSVELMKRIDPDWQPPSGQRLGLAFHCGTAAGVDETHAAVVAAGFSSKDEPWDAFWGQRYARVIDPDGNVVDLFASG